MSAAPTDADAIEPLVAERAFTGRRATFLFRCPVSGEEARAEVHLPQGADLATIATSAAHSGLFYWVRHAVFSLVRRLFGHGAAGRMIGDVASHTLDAALRQQTQATGGLSKEERAAALLQAFERVSNRFIWDESGGRWIARRAAPAFLGTFERRLAESPVEHPYDRQVLARVLVEVARADGRLESEEATWLTQFADDSVQEISSRPPLTDAELEQVSAPVRETILMLGWAIAFIDEALADAERDALVRLARGMAMAPERVVFCRRAAQEHILEQALERMLTWGGHDVHAREQLQALAGQIGVSAEEAEQIEARYQRRRSGGR